MLNFVNLCRRRTPNTLNTLYTFCNKFYDLKTHHEKPKIMPSNLIATFIYFKMANLLMNLSDNILLYLSSDIQYYLVTWESTMIHQSIYQFKTSLSALRKKSDLQPKSIELSYVVVELKILTQPLSVSMFYHVLSWVEKKYIFVYILLKKQC